MCHTHSWPQQEASGIWLFKIKMNINLFVPYDLLHVDTPHSSKFLLKGQVKVGQFSIQHFPSCFNEISQGSRVKALFSVHIDLFHVHRGVLILQQYDCNQTITQEFYFWGIGELSETHRGNPCYDLQGFPTELTPQVIPCCIVRIFEECRGSQIPCTFYYMWALMG